MFFACNVFLHGESRLEMGQKLAGIEHDVIHGSGKSRWQATQSRSVEVGATNGRG